MSEQTKECDYCGHRHNPREICDKCRQKNNDIRQNWKGKDFDARPCKIKLEEAQK